MKKMWIAASVLACTGLSAWAALPGAVPAALTGPLPEPETYAAMLAGLAALTLLGRRRVRKAQD